MGPWGLNTSSIQVSKCNGKIKLTASYNEEIAKYGDRIPIFAEQCFIIQIHV
jgi:hypothetical protein